MMRKILILVVLIAVASSQTLLPLKEGEVTMGSVQPWGYTYYNVTLPFTESTGDITVSVTPFNGDPDLLASQTETYPAEGAKHTWRSADVGGDFMLIRSEEFDNTKPLFIAVYGFGAETTKFTITVNRGKFQDLAAGTPEVGQVAKNTERFYRFRFPASTDHVTVVLTAESLFGIRIFANGIRNGTNDDALENYPSKANGYLSQWSSMYNYPRRFVARKGTKGWCGQQGDNAANSPAPVANTECHLWLTVMGMDYMLNATNFQLTASTSEDLVHLQIGTPQYDIVPDNNGYAHFDFYVDEHLPVSVSLTALSGNPNLYVSKTANPSATNNIWNSTFWGTDSIEISDRDPQFALDTTYYIGVGGTAGSFFVLTVSYATNTTDVIDSLPRNDHLDAGEVHHFRYWAEPFKTTHSIQFTLNSLAGTTPWILVSRTGYPEFNADWSDVGFGGTASVDIASNDPNLCVNCHYYITVREQANRAMDYSLLVSSAVISVQLQDGVAQTSLTVGNKQWRYFVVTLNIRRDLIISLTPSRGDPDIFVDTVFRHPQQNNSTWKSTGTYTDTVTIRTDHAKYCVYCDYYIGIFGFSEAEFTLLAAHSDTTIPLTLGQLQDSRTPAGTYTYFSVRVADIGEGITVAVNPTGGYPSMYVSTAGVPDPGDARYPSMWYRSGQPAILTLGKGGPNVCSFCTYYIAVGSAWSNVTYSIQAYLEGQAQRLSMGVATAGEIQNQGHAYYYATVSGTDDVTIEVTSFGQDPDIFVSNNNTRPSGNPGEHQWSGIEYGNDRVLIPAKDLHCTVFGECKLYIAVYNYRPALLRFTVTINQGSGMLLVAGQAQQDSLPPGQERHIELRIPRSGRFSVTLTSTRGTPSIWMSGENTGTSYPNATVRTSYQWWSTTGNPVILTASEGDDGYCTRPVNSTCRYFITVRAREPTASLVYTITAAADTQVVPLQLGVPQFDSVQAGKYRYYVFYPSTLASPIQISITTISGDPDIYISRTNPQPSARSSDWKSENFGDDTLVINPLADNKACQPQRDENNCVYYVAVKNFRTTQPATYTLLVSIVGMHTELMLGVPQTGIVSNDNTSIAYYSLDVPPVVEDRIQISLNFPSRGVADLFVSTDPYPITPSNHTSFQWSSTQGVPVIVIIRPNEGTNWCTDCTYYIGIAAHSGATGPVRFSITASASNETITLRPGVAQIGAVTPYAFAYFEVTFPNRTDVHIAVTPLAGRNEDPDILVTCKKLFPKPNWASNPMWIGAYSGADEVVIRASDPNYCDDNTFAIGVTDIVEYESNEIVTFSITAFQTDGFTALQEGQPQSGALSDRSSVRHYMYTVDDASSLSVTDYVTFMVTPDFGAPAIYIATSQLHPEMLQDETFPVPGDKTTYDIVNDVRTPSIMVSLGHNDTAFCSSCSYLITIANSPNATSTSSSYSLVASSSKMPITIQTGVPTQGRVRPNEDVTFYFSTNNKITSDITVTTSLVAGGDASVQVNAGTGLWRLDSIALTDVLTIPSAAAATACANLNPCRFEITVSGKPWANHNISPTAPIDFIITASMSQDTIFLTPGVPVVTTVSSTVSRRFKVSVPTIPSRLTISCTGPTNMTIGANPNLARQDNRPTPDNWPTPANMGKWKSATQPVTYLTIEAIDVKNANTIYILVTTPAGTTNPDYPITVSAAFEDSLIQLREGVPSFTGVTPKNSVAFVADFGSEERVDHYISFAALQGSGMIFITYGSLDPVANTKWTATVEYDVKNPANSARDIVISADSGPCLEARAAGTSCSRLSMEVRAGSDLSLFTVTTKSPDGTPSEVFANIPQLISISPELKGRWLTYRLAPLTVDRDGTILSDSTVSGADDVYIFYSTMSVKPPTENPADAIANKIPEASKTQYKSFKGRSSQPVSLKNGAPLYLFVTSVANIVTQARLTIKLEVNPATSSNPIQVPSSTKEPKKGLSGPTMAIIAIGSILGLALVIGFVVVFSRFNLIRKIYKSSNSKRGYAEVTLG